MKDQLFFKVFRNIYLRNKILCFIHRDKVDLSYVSTVSLDLMVENYKFNMVLDKLKSKSYILVNKNGLKLLLSSSSINPYFREIFDLLWCNYNEKIRILNPLKLLINLKNSTQLFKYIYNNYYCVNSNSNSNSGCVNSIKFDQRYRLYDLLDDILKSKKFKYNNNQIPQYISELLNNIEDLILHPSSSSPSLSYSSSPSSSSSSLIPSISSNNNNKFYNIINQSYSGNKRLLNSIYFNNNIPVLGDYNILNISKEKLKFINNDLKLDIITEIKNNKNNKPQIHFYASEDNFNCKNSLDLYLSMCLYGDYRYVFNQKKYYMDSLQLVKMFVLDKVSDNKKINIQHFKQYLIENEDKSNNIGNFIKVVQDYSYRTGNIINTISDEELVFYFDVHLFYYLLKEKNFEMVKNYLENQNFTFKDLQVRYYSSFRDIKSRVITLIHIYSLHTLSQDEFDYYNENIYLYDGSYEFVFFQPLLVGPDDLEDKKILKERASLFFENACTEDKSWSGETSQNESAIECLLDNYGGEFILNMDAIFKEFYLGWFLTSENRLSKLFKARNGKLDFKLIDFTLEYTKEIIFTYKSNPSLFEAEYIASLLNHFFKTGYKNNNHLFEEILCDIYRKLQILEVDESIEVYKQLDQDLINNFIIQMVKSSSNIILEFQQYLKNKVNILLLSLILSVKKNDIISINKILSTIYNNNNISVPSEFNNNNINNSNQLNYNSIINNGLEILKWLSKNGYLEIFETTLLTTYINNYLKYEHNILKDLILDSIPSSNTSLIEYFREYFYDSVTIHYNLEDYLAKENKDNIVISNSQDKNDKETQLELLFTKGYYSKVLEYIGNENVLINTKVKELKFFIPYINISTEWFKKLDNFIMLHLDQPKNIINFCLNNNFSIFELIWEKLNNDDRKLFLKELFKDRRIDNAIYLLGSSIFYQDLQEYILNEKKESILETFSDKNHINDLFKLALIFGNISIFKQIRSIFNSHEFTFDSKFFEDFLFFNYSIESYCCDVLEYLYENNFIPNFSLIICNLLSKLGFSGRTPSCIGVSKSTFILIHLIIKSQEINHK